MPKCVFSYKHAQHFLLNMHSNQTKSPAAALLNFLFKIALFRSLNRTEGF